MKPILLSVFSALCLTGTYYAAQAQTPIQLAAQKCSSLLQHELPDIDGKKRKLCDFQGQVLLVVNTASFCGYTPQYEQLQALHERYHKQGFSVLGFPANNFGKQEPGSNKEIKDFCQEKFKVSFPLFAKSVVVGKKANPFFQQLAAKTGDQPLWNFHKYLIDRQGHVVKSFSSSVRPDDKKLQAEIQSFLAKKS